MITPLDITCMQIIQGETKVDKAHYHLADPPLSHPGPVLEEANFHLVERNISLNQVGFDYYSNLVTYRV